MNDTTRGQQLKTYREQAGLSQKAAAEKAHVSLGLVQSAEHGKIGRKGERYEKVLQRLASKKGGSTNGTPERESTTARRAAPARRPGRIGKGSGDVPGYVVKAFDRLPQERRQAVLAIAWNVDDAIRLKISQAIFQGRAQA